MKKNIFVIGTGRSGTHWLGYILESSPEIKMNIEVRPIFSWVTIAAIDTNKRKYLMPLITAYYNVVGMFYKRHFADKSHPNLWLVDTLIKYVPNSHFIGIIRNPHATVSSMLLHPKVLNWVKIWEKFPVPNEFLGITEENRGEYALLPIEAKCTIRWIAHKRKLAEVSAKYPKHVLMVDYDKLMLDSENELKKIEHFIGLQKSLPLPEIKMDSKDKWKTNLTNEQIAIINETLEKNGFYNEII